ncbi:MAG TPA: DUF309 domain-containing protein [Sulfurimonas autotrophica]|uniref:DUF309 domain-containing protein n=1 Tax=Sulfurimonas autotrophica TaxID=202747 RepID=A0A7C3FYK4_9BACT|nr:DUF309 domain-containing protein [Sulfurimonas autotrophica]
MTQNKLDEFRECLREERFYDAHEALEALWFPRRFEDDSEVKLLKGFINAAVSFELVKKGRIPQSKKVWQSYLKYRQLLFKVNSPYLNEYYQLSRKIEFLRYNTVL